MAGASASNPLVRVKKDGSVVRGGGGGGGGSGKKAPAPSRYPKNKIVLMEKLLRKYWREEKRGQAAKKWKTKIPPPTGGEQVGTGQEGVRRLMIPKLLPGTTVGRKKDIVPPMPRVVDTIARWVKRNVTLDGNHIKAMETGDNSAAAQLVPADQFPGAVEAGIPTVSVDGVPAPEEQTGRGPEEKTEGEIEAALGSEVAQHDMIVIPQGDRHTVFKHPTQMLIGGPTKSGKTTLLMRLLRERGQMFSHPFEKIYWFYKMENSIRQARQEFPEINYVEGHVSNKFVEGLDIDSHKMLIMDDMQELVANSKSLEALMNIFTRDSHHKNLTVIFLVQDLFMKNMHKVARQCENVIAMSNGSSGSNIMNMGRRQFGPGTAPFIKWALTQVRLQSTHGYLCLSSGAGISPCESCKTFIFPGEPNTFFVAKGTPQDRTYIALKSHALAGKKDIQKGSGQTAAPTATAILPPPQTIPQHHGQSEGWGQKWSRWQKEAAQQRKQRAISPN